MLCSIITMMYILIIFLCMNLYDCFTQCNHCVYCMKTELCLKQHQDYDFQNTFINYKYMSSNKSSQTALLLIHGFGANHHHWRYNIPVLSQKYDTYAVDLFGFGNSSQHIEFPYTVSFWSSQVNYFIETVIKRPTILVGNSLGGYVIMNSVSLSLSKNIVGMVLINPLILSKNKNTIPMDNNWSYSKFFVKSYFYYLRNKSIIHFFLNKLYPVFPKKIDDYLLNSIYYSACKKNASEVFYKILLENIVKPTVFIENILPNIDIPTLFIYGDKDVWIDPKSTIEQMKNYSKIEFVSVNAGHCPHDEIPEIINEKILNFTRILDV
jgi:pimeloyl-ACP methyl ester carboxylesterase